MKTFVGAAILSAASASELPLARCSGSDDPAAVGVCYKGAAGIGALKETVTVDLKTFASAKGTLALSGSGITGFKCADHAFTKSGQDITADLSDCLPAGITLDSVKYCSSTDQIHVVVKDKAVPIPFGATLSKVACGADEFDEFMTDYARTYVSAVEQEYRRQVFHTNLAWINAENTKGKSHTVGVTQFADLTFEEFKAEYLTGYMHTPKNASLGIFHAPADFVEAESVDWSTQGAVTPVKNQAHCGSCWSFSATGALEGAWKIAGHGLVSLSEQNILDCDKGGHKCQGGSMEQSFDWVKENGICSETDDPYKCADQSSSECTGSTCSASSGTCTKVLKPDDVTGSTEVGQTEGALEAAVTKQPVSIAIEADKPVFQHYKSGTVLSSEACGSQLDHGVLAVGFGSSADGTKYWKVKNSWGATWGENGYLRMEKGASWSGGECGIRKAAVFPSVSPAKNVAGIVV